jgi:hypothetical protein
MRQGVIRLSGTTGVCKGGEGSLGIQNSKTGNATVRRSELTTGAKAIHDIDQNQAVTTSEFAGSDDLKDARSPS